MVARVGLGAIRVISPWADTVVEPTTQHARTTINENNRFKFFMDSSLYPGLYSHRVIHEEQQRRHFHRRSREYQKRGLFRVYSRFVSDTVSATLIYIANLHRAKNAS